MDISFAKAPLLEIIAEVRWAPTLTLAPADVGRPIATPTFLIGDSKDEEFFMRLGGELYQAGFQLSERLVLPGFPSGPHQAIYRYRSDKPALKSVLYQVGLGVFSIHGVPPYQSWRQFAPFVTSGISALLNVRRQTDEGSPFIQLSLRYLDFFDEELSGGRSPQAFISEVLQISTSLPAGLMDLSPSKELRTLFVKFSLPIEMGELSLSVGDGKSGNRPGFVMDTAVTCTRRLSAELPSLMGLFDNAHSVTNMAFRELTKPIEAQMQPQRIDV